MNDLISREEAIKAMIRHFPSLSEVDARWVLSDIEGTVMCKGCQHWFAGSGVDHNKHG